MIDTRKKTDDGTAGFTVGECLLHQADQRPSSPFVTDADSGETLTYRQTADTAAVVTSRLRESGVRAGDRVVLLAENSWRWVAAFFGIQQAGAICVPVNTRLGARDLAPVIADADPTCIVGDTRHFSTLDEGWASACTDLRELIAGPSDRVELADPTDWSQPSDVGVITYTSGTTGAAKGVMLSQRAVVGSGATMASVFGTHPASRTASMAPLFHNTGFIDAVMQMAVTGGHVEVFRRFRPEDLHAGITSGDLTCFVGVPTMYVRLVDLLAEEVSDAAPLLAYGGAAMTQATILALHRSLPNARLVNVYGLSEATSLTHYLPFELAPGRWEAVGIPVPGTWDRLADPAGAEIEICSPNAMVGYWNRPELTAERLVDDCWLRTGDLGVRDDEGMLWVRGRADDIINRGGEKIAPFEVESALAEHPDVIDVCVVGIPDREFGEVVAAAVILSKAADASEDGLRGHVRARLADYKVPVRVLALDQFPRNSHGKVMRRHLRELLATCSQDQTA